MPRRVNRTPEDQQAFEIVQRNNRAERQRIRREASRQSVIENNRG